MKKQIKSSIISPVIKKRIKKFKTLRRGYYSFLIILAAYLLSFFVEFAINGNPIFVKYDGDFYFTAYNTATLKKDVSEKEVEARKSYFGARRYRNKPEKVKETMNQYYKADSEYKKIKLTTKPQEEINAARVKAEELSEKYEQAKKYENISMDELNALKEKYYSLKEIKLNVSNGRLLKKVFKEQNSSNFAVLSPYCFGPNESLLDELGTQPPTRPDGKHWLGTDDRGRDVFARLVYGFRISISFSILLLAVGYTIGIIVGAIIGYYGGKIDFFAMRLIEIWSSLPFLFTVMIISSIVIPNFFILVFILSIWGWIGTVWYIRAEFLREKQKDYVHAALAIGVSDRKIIFSHILPNALTPLIASFPFRIISGIGSLVSLDFLGFGLPAPTPSWGELLGQGTQNLHSWWLVLSPVGAMFITLLLVTFIGEAIREAFDPKVYSRLR